MWVKVLIAIGSGIGGALIGAVALTLAAAILISLIPGVRNDGQSCMIVFLTVPVGAALGFVIGACLVGFGII